MAYGASKAGLINLTQNLARALAPEARANAVAPGFVDTDWTRPWPQARKQSAIERSLLKRACTPADIAAAIVFLCTDTSMVIAGLGESRACSGKPMFAATLSGKGYFGQWQTHDRA